MTPASRISRVLGRLGVVGIVAAVSIVPSVGSVSARTVMLADSGQHLVFLAEPAAAAPGLPFAVQPVVAIEDSSGNIVTDAGTTVLLELGIHPGGAKLACTTGPTVATVGGVATFSGCLIKMAASGYTLVATAGGFSNVSTPPFDVATASSNLSIAASRTVTNVLQPTILTVDFGVVGSNRTVRIQKKTTIDTTFGLQAEVTTDAQGKATLQVAPDMDTWYRAAYPGTKDLAAATSVEVLVGVHRSIALHGGPPPGAKAIKPGRQLTFRVAIRSHHDLARVTFRVLRWNGRRWVAFTSATVTADASGHASYTRTWSASGKWRVQATTVASAFNLAGLSNTITFTVR
jgi:hypothetical protein